MVEPLTTFVVSTLAGLGVNFLSFISKKSKNSIKKLFSEDELEAVLNQAYQDFKDNCFKSEGTKDEKILLQVFQEFFADKKIAYEFQLVFARKEEEVDFNVLEEIFVGICIDKKIEIKDFNFFQAMSRVIKEIETLLREKGLIRQTDHLEKIYKQLEKPGMVTNKTYARQTYLRQLITHNRHLQFTGIPDPKEKKDIALPSVFVMQRVKESVPVSDYERLMQERTGGDEAFTGDEIQLRRMMAVQKEEKKEPVKFDKVFAESENRRFVVLGKPGSGKSTLLKYLMLTSAQEILDNHRKSQQLLFPILVEIRKFENALSKTNKNDYNILHYLYDSMSRYYNVTMPPGFFEEYLDSGRALLMFDGLDEVAVEARRAEVRQMIGTFVTSRSEENTVIVTSRIAGYSRAQFSTTDYCHFTLEDFNEEEVEEFIHKWYQSRLTNPEEAKTRADDLKGALEKQPRIGELAKNPLLLTIIGIIHRYEAQLPEDRLILYDKTTESLLETWDNVKEIIDEKFKLEDRRRFLEKVAFQLQSLEKGDEAGTLIHRNELYKILFPDFCRLFCCDNRQARELVDKFLKAIRLRAGLLVEQSPDQYGFVHKTFQEYFAARWIANETILKFNLQIIIDYMDKYIDNAFWQETLLLALRALLKTEAQKVLKHVLNRDPKGIETYFYHNHYFVMKFISEQGTWLGDKAFVEKQVIDFFDFSWNKGKTRSSESIRLVNRTWARFKSWVSTVTDSLVHSILSDRLLSLAEDEKQDGDLRSKCALAMGNLGLKDQLVVERLLRLAEDEKQEDDLRRDCATAVGNLGLKDQAVVERLLCMAEDEKQSYYLKRDCASAVENLGLKDQAVEILLRLAEDEEPNEKRAGCHRPFCPRNLVDKYKADTECLMRLAEDEKQTGYFRRICAEALENLGLRDQAVEILLRLAEDEKQDGSLRRYCAFSVGNTGLKDQTVVERLLRLAEDEKQEGNLRRSCAEAVGNLGLKDQAVVERLLRLVEDEKQYVGLRCYCAVAIGNLGFKDQAVVERLLRLTEDENQEGYLRGSCAEAVGNLGLKDQAVEILLRLAEDEKQEDMLRRDCAEAVGHLGYKDKAAAVLLVLAEDEKQDGGLRRDCAQALGKLGFKDKAIKILIELYLAHTDKYEEEAQRIYDALWDVTAL